VRKVAKIFQRTWQPIDDRGHVYARSRFDILLVISVCVCEVGISRRSLAFIFVSFPFEFFQKRGPHKVGNANKFMPRCALNFEEHGARYAGLDRSAVGSRKYFTAIALSKGVVCGSQGTALLLSPLHLINTLIYTPLLHYMIY
jgi:hypothetical protein